MLGWEKQEKLLAANNIFLEQKVQLWDHCYRSHHTDNREHQLYNEQQLYKENLQKLCRRSFTLHCSRYANITQLTKQRKYHNMTKLGGEISIWSCSCKLNDHFGSSLSKGYIVASSLCLSGQTFCAFVVVHAYNGCNSTPSPLEACGLANLIIHPIPFLLHFKSSWSIVWDLWNALHAQRGPGPPNLMWTIGRVGVVNHLDD